MEAASSMGPHGFVHKLGWCFAGVPVLEALPFDVHVRAPDSWKLPYGAYMVWATANTMDSGPEFRVDAGFLYGDYMRAPTRARLYGIHVPKY